MKSVADFSCSGKKVIVRVDFNVPLDEQASVLDDTRIREAVPTIKKILADGGSVILLSHLGRPKRGPEERFSLKQITPVVQKHFDTEVQFAADCIGSATESLAAGLKPGEILLCENVRFHSEETSGDEGFAGQLAALGDAYVNDAFGTAHRTQGSTAVIARFFEPENRMIGLLMQREIENANRVLRDAEKPMTIVLGGAKVSDKIMLIRNLLPMADHIIIGGGMAFTFIKARGGSVGDSLLEADRLTESAGVLRQAEESQTQIHIPEDVVAADAFDDKAKTQIVPSNQIPEGWMGLDIGPQTAQHFATVIGNSRTIVWNGPMGVFEMKPFQAGSEAVANSIANVTAQGAYSLVGGGDSVAVLKMLDLTSKMSYVSTGGGALLEMLEGKELPGIAAVLN